MWCLFSRTSSAESNRSWVAELIQTVTDYTIEATTPFYSSYFNPLPIYIHIATSRSEPESNPRRSGLPTLMSPTKLLFPTRLTESTESIAIHLVYVLQDERYASLSWISCIYRVLSYKMCVKWSNMKYRVSNFKNLAKDNTHIHALVHVK